MKWTDDMLYAIVLFGNAPVPLSRLISYTLSKKIAHPILGMFQFYSFGKSHSLS